MQKTLKLWLEQFDKNIGQVRDMGFDEKFIRTWRYYLSIVMPLSK